MPNLQKQSTFSQSEYDSNQFLSSISQGKEQPMLLSCVRTEEGNFCLFSPPTQFIVRGALQVSNAIISNSERVVVVHFVEDGCEGEAV